MRRVSTAVILSVFLVLPLRAETLTFDDIVSMPTCNSGLPTPYGGLNWSSGFLLECNADYTGTQGNTYSSPSGQYAATNSSDVGGGLIDVSISSGTFDFLGASFSSFAYANGFAPYSAESLELIGYRPGDSMDPTYVTAFDLDPKQYVDSVFDWTGLTDLMFGSGDGPAADMSTTFGVDGLSWLMDDAQFNVNSSTTVPEPGSAVLLGVGILALIARRVRSGHYLMRGGATRKGV